MSEYSIRPHRYKLFTVGAIGTFMATLDGSILNVALPTISADLGAPIESVAWVVLAYSLTLISLMLIFGAWVNSRGYFFGYRFGYVLFIIGSILCALSTNIYFLVGSRVIQAVGAAMFAAIGPGMVTEVFGAKERGKGIGMMVMMVSAGFMVGPPLGGFMLGFFSWHSIFIINVPIGIIGMIMTYKYIRMIKLSETTKPINLKGPLAMSTSLLSFTIVLSLFNDFPIYDIRILGGTALAIVAMLLFIKYESNESTAMLGIHIFKNKQFSTSIAAMVCMFTSASGISILIPFYLENIRGFVPKEVGMFLILVPIMMFVFAPLSGKLSDRIGYRLLTMTGLLVIMSGVFMITFFEPNSTVIYLVITFGVLGIGNGIFTTPNSSALMGSVTEKERAVTSSILATTRNIGMSVGVALSTTLFAIFETRFAKLGSADMIFIESLKYVCYSAMIILFIGLIAAFIRGKGEKKQPVAQ